MFVKKFEADTLEEALKQVKTELGPDAIILKTITNNGLKGAFKKKRIEITAAISEKTFEKKAKVDKVLNEDQKQSLYQKPATQIKETINKYNASQSTGEAGGYGAMGLNKVVNSITKSSAGLSDLTNKTSHLIKNSLEDFLSDGVEDFTESDSSDEMIQIPSRKESRGKYSEPPVQDVVKISSNGRKNAEQSVPNSAQPVKPSTQTQDMSSPVNMVSREAYNEIKQELKTTQNKLQLLEQKILELGQNYQFNQKHLNEANGIYQLRTTLKTLDIDDSIINELIKKIHYQISKDDQEIPDVVFEFALKEMANSIHTESALFAKVDNTSPVITVLISEAASGQSTMGTKIAVLKKDVVVVHFSQDAQNGQSTDFASQVFGIKVEKAQSYSEAIGFCRKSLESGKSVLLDLRLNSKGSDETKKFIESLRRSFSHIEVLCTLSAIHSELYNRKIIARYKEFTDGVIISHVDLCLNFGALYNVHKANNKLPLKFFGTGPVVPDDIEAATAERLMAGLFDF